MTIKVSDLVGKYVQIRDKRAEIKKAYTDKDDVLKDALAKIEAALLKVFSAQGLDNVKTPVGTAYIAKRSSATVGDWDTLFSFIQEQGAWELLDRRVSKVAVDEFVAAHDDLPPGVNYSTAVTINIRRS